VYVWAVEQDELSKRSIPADETGQDVFIPWVLSQQPTGKESRTRANGANPKIAAGQLVFNRYYHMFAHGELAELVRKAAGELGLHVGSRDDSPEQNIRGLEIVQDGWERSNYFVELRRWER
jgi:tRNA (uracil-5-)-methyltransferase TRM9